jgi:serine protease
MSGYGPRKPTSVIAEAIGGGWNGMARMSSRSSWRWWVPLLVLVTVASFEPVSAHVSAHANRRPAKRHIVVPKDAAGTGAGQSAAHQVTHTPPVRSTTSPRFRPGTVLVGFERDTTRTQQRSIEAAAGAAESKIIGAGTHVLHVRDGRVFAAITRLEANRRVRYAEPDYAVHTLQAPNDPLYNQLWGMPDVSADSAWDVTGGTKSVVIGVVDTGIDYTHPDLAANVWTNDGSINNCAAGTHGYNAITGSCDPMDDNKHGTHVSGTIGAVGNNGIGVIGVNPTTSMMGLKFLSAGGSGTTSGAIQAIDWAINAKNSGVNIRVLSNSWGGGGYDQSLSDEINKAGANDILFVAAAGNYASNNDVTPLYPCSYGAANEICVAAIQKRKDSLASFSNYGINSVDLAAPGENILSTVPGDQYATLSGTSMATPFVAGAAALVLSMGYRSVRDLKSTILSSVDPLASLAGVVGTGGKLDVDKAVLAAAPPPPPPIADFALSVSPSGRQSVARGSAVSFVVTATLSGGQSGQIALGVSGLPSDASVAFRPDPLDLVVGTSSTLTVTTTSTTPRGRYTLTITGVSGSLTRTATALLTIKRR